MIRVLVLLALLSECAQSGQIPQLELDSAQECMEHSLGMKLAAPIKSAVYVEPDTLSCDGHPVVAGCAYWPSRRIAVDFFAKDSVYEEVGHIALWDNGYPTEVHDKYVKPAKAYCAKNAR